MEGRTQEVKDTRNKLWPLVEQATTSSKVSEEVKKTKSDLWQMKLLFCKRNNSSGGNSAGVGMFNTYKGALSFYVTE